MKQIVVVSGGFDPIHSGHIASFQEARKISDLLIVGINSGSRLARKKGSAFMQISERKNIVEHLKMVDKLILFDDEDDSAKDEIKMVRKKYPINKIILANGGDQTENNIPKMDVEGENLDFFLNWGNDIKLEEWSNYIEKSLNQFIFQRLRNANKISNSFCSNFMGRVVGQDNNP